MTTLLEYIGIASAIAVSIVAIVGYLGRKIIEHYLSRDVSVFKSELEHQASKHKLEQNKELEKFKLELDSEAQKSKLEIDKQIETYKSSLNLISNRQSKLYDRRLKVLEELYQKIVRMNRSMIEMTALVKLVKEDGEKEEVERIKKAAEDGNNFMTFYQENKIYFEPKTCELLDDLEKKFSRSYNDYSFKNIFHVPMSKAVIESTRNASKIVQEEIPPVLIALEKDFRYLIGVLEKE